MTRKIKSFSLTELLVVIAVFAILLSILSMSMKKVFQTVWLIQCANQQNGLGHAESVFAADNDDKITPACWGVKLSWDDFLSPYDGRNLTATQQNWSFISKNPSHPYYMDNDLNQQYICPADKDNQILNGVDVSTGNPSQIRYLKTYAINGEGCQNTSIYPNALPTGISNYTDSDSPIIAVSRKFSQVADSSRTILITGLVYSYERNTLGGIKTNPSYGLTTSIRSDHNASTINYINRILPHGDGLMWNYLFCDGHVLALYPFETIDANGNMWTSGYD